MGAHPTRTHLIPEAQRAPTPAPLVSLHFPSHASWAPFPSFCFYFLQLLIKPLLSCPHQPPLPPSSPSFLLISSLISVLSVPVSLYLLISVSLPVPCSPPPLLSPPASSSSSSSSSWRVRGVTLQEADTVRQMLPRPVTKEVVSLATEMQARVPLPGPLAVTVSTERGKAASGQETRVSGKITVVA